MSDSQLLTKAKPYCNPDTGEVVKRIPEPLMQQLRKAKLARGIRGRKSEETQTHATWFVFLTEEIRDARLSEWREANRRKRQTGRTSNKV